MPLTVKLRSVRGSYRLEFECESATGSVWLSELPGNALRIAIDGTGFFDIDDSTKERDG